MRKNQLKNIFTLPHFAPSPLMGEGWDEGENQDRDPSLMLFK
jgi:hypothetical protein